MYSCVQDGICVFSLDLHNFKILRQMLKEIVPLLCLEASQCSVTIRYTLQFCSNYDPHC